ncbi:MULTISPECIES: hypothetical protein [Flavobacterium]|uniref:hypothetical protein n=1 Tax=Flavobacterium TaxID=237 RepID=UPI002114AB79|nr:MULTISPECIES: hypothetical protein [Flavobacterium]UUF15743.1 hypothetical protein NLJ00_06395 [Flavobacterium panici]
MNLEDFIENANELGVVALESDQLKEISGGIGGPANSGAAWKREAAFLYYMTEECYTC